MFVLFTDFGWSGPYVGQMKAVLAAGAPDRPVVDLMHDAPSFSPRAGAYLLSAYTGALPLPSTVIAVVDPGVGSDRRPIALRADGCWYIGPDNGLLSRVAARARHLELFELAVPASASATFHGRDVFAAAAVDLARGDLARARLSASNLVGHDWADDLYEVLYVDHYGNAVTGVRGMVVDERTRFAVGGAEVRHARTFSDVPPGEPFWYVNSSGLLEFAVNQGRADAQLGLRSGDPVWSV